MSRHAVKSVSEFDTKKPQISLPVSNENIVHLDRRLRSDKPDAHYYITSPLPPRDLGVEFAQPTPLTVTPNSTFGAVGGHEQVIDSLQRAEEEVVGDELEEVEGAEESEEKEEEEVLIPPPQPFIAPPDFNPVPVGPIPVAVADDESPMAEGRTLLLNQFGGGPDEDPAKFWRRLDNYVAYKNLAAINQSINSLITEMSKRTSTCEKHKAVKYT